MAVYNTLVGVVANIEADDKEDALRILRSALERSGFIPYEDDQDAFEAEAGTVANPLPA
jgi:hypothetical protein